MIVISDCSVIIVFDNGSLVSRFIMATRQLAAASQPGITQIRSTTHIQFTGKSVLSAYKVMKWKNNHITHTGEQSHNSYKEKKRIIYTV